MDHDDPDQRQPTPPPAGPWRLLGYDRRVPGSARWLGRDGTPTRRPELAVDVPDYQAAERLAADLTERRPYPHLPTWMPARADRALDDLQATHHRPRPAGIPSARTARLGVPSPP